MSNSLSRREMMVCAGLGLGAAAVSTAVVRAAEKPSSEPFGYCLNTGTIRGQNLGPIQEAEVAAKAGYRGLEPWVSSLQAYADRGGSLPDLRKRIADLGLSVESAIAFGDWIGDDAGKRAADAVLGVRRHGLAAILGDGTVQKAFQVAGRKPGVVLDLGGQSQLPQREGSRHAVLLGDRPLEDQRLKRRPGGIDRGGPSGGAAADDDHFFRHGRGSCGSRQ